MGGSGIELRDYQLECIETIASKETGRFLVQMATGLGKTVTFSRIPTKGRMLLLSHRDELVRQPERYFAGRTFGIEKAGQGSHGEEVVSASVQTLSRGKRLEKFSPDDFDIIVTDEAHHAAAPSYRKIYDYFKPRLHIGFTATPNRGDKVRLDEVFDDIIFERSLLWGIENGWLCDINAKRISLGYNPANVKSRLGDYIINDLERAVNTQSNNELIAKAYEEFATGPTVIFAITREHARQIASLIPGSVVIDGTTPAGERRDTLNRFKRGKIGCLVNCMVLTEGTDLPNIATIIIARPTRSQALYTQMVGRGTRLSPGKKELLLMDCVGVSDDKDLCCVPTLAGIDPTWKPADASCDEGLLSKMKESYAAANDTPIGWILAATDARLFAKNMGGIAWTRMYDGAFTVSTGESDLLVTPANKLGKCSLFIRQSYNGKTMQLVKKASLEYCFETARKYLEGNCWNTRILWMSDQVERWAANPASEKQLTYIMSLAKKTDVDVSKYFESGAQPSKQEAGTLIVNLKRKCVELGIDYMSSTGAPTEKQERYLLSLMEIPHQVYQLKGMTRGEATVFINAFKLYNQPDYVVPAELCELMRRYEPPGFPPERQYCYAEARDLLIGKFLALKDE